MGKRDGLVKAYLAALDVRAVVILASADGSKAQPQTAKQSVNLQDGAAVFDALWFTKPEHAEIVLTHYLENCDAEALADGHGWLNRSPRECRDDVIDMAGMLGAPWQTNEQISTTALAAVVEIENRVEAMRTSGGLAQVNAEFKSYRKRMQSVGQGAMSYTVFLARFTGALVELVAAKATLAGQTQFGDLRALARSTLSKS